MVTVKWQTSEPIQKSANLTVTMAWLLCSARYLYTSFDAGSIVSAVTIRAIVVPFFQGKTIPLVLSP